MWIRKGGFEMKKWISVLIPLALLAFPNFSLAEKEKKDSQSLTTLDEVVVTAGRVKEKKKDITTNVTIINKDQIKDSSAKDLGDLLAENGIGHIQKYPGALTSFGIRGFRTEAHGNDLEGYVLVLINGRRAGTGNAAKIMTKNIERIEIIRGPASVQYGSAAMGGVVNVITRQGKEKPSIFIEGMIGSYKYKEGGVGFSGKHKGFDFSGSFTTGSMDDYKTGDGEEYYNTGYDHKDSCSINLGYEFLPKNRIGVIYNYFDADHVGNPGYISTNDLDDYNDSNNYSI
jgi:vitamin B12 transporter